MKVALQLGLIPGQSVADKQKWAADHGVDGIEISTGDYRPDMLDQAKRDFEKSPVPISTVCGNPSFDFLDPDPGKRRASLEQSKAYLRFCGEVGAVGQIVPPIFGGPRINNLEPLYDAVTLEKMLLVELVKELGDVAGEAGSVLLLEPLNRYEQHLLRRLDDGVEICRRAKHPAVWIMADFFHMHIEETSSPRALRRAGKFIRHCHLADNTRLEPGSGDINFVSAFRALRAVGFEGYMAYECGISGPDREASLARSLEFVRGCLTRV
ncbi:MAG: sugar phosphate isomerase/epimerase [Armatimonadetes bacterium]|nr:sugar phosphate isomerase/epimerase [Armatimonadota bacterium]